MNCPFCQEELYVVESFNYRSYCCSSILCMVNNDFPRYRCAVGESGKIRMEEYSMDNFYVKVDKHGTSIYRLKSYLLTDEVRVPRPLWLNFTNLGRSLDKLKLCAIFS